MNKINVVELKEVKGGSLSSTFLNALMRTFSGVFEIGQAVGSAIRRISGKSYCSY